MYNNFYRNIGTIIKNARDNEQLSLRELAKLSDISYATISLIEKGNEKCPLDTLRKLCNALGLDWIEVLKCADTNVLSYSELSELRAITNIYEKLTPKERRKMLNIVKAVFIE
jgi:transcriptional regulator with XRE-family HTH domain